MSLGAKFIRIKDSCSPYQSAETFVAAMLLEMGGKIFVDPEGQQAAFQDATHERTGEREFVLLLDGSTEFAFPTGKPKPIADVHRAIRSKGFGWRSVIYEALKKAPPSEKPIARVKHLRPSDAPDELWVRSVEQYRLLLESLQQLPRHIAVPRGGRLYYVHAGTEEEIEEQIASFDH
ncbi:MAG: hypothetical protein AAF236_00790 [Verrucomicrobiota bacterium]